MRTVLEAARKVEATEGPGVKVMTIGFHGWHR